MAPHLQDTKIKQVMIFYKYLAIALFIAAGIFISVSSARAADYYYRGILKSKNVLSGADVTAITDFRVTASIPASTTVSVSFSQDRISYYSASSTKGAWTACANGTTIIDLSELGWIDEPFFYKLKLETTDASNTPVVSDIRVNFTGSAVPDATSTQYYGRGILLSDNLLSGASVSAITGFRATTSLPGGSIAQVNFSQDKINFYSASGTPGAWDSLSEGGNFVDLAGLGWSGASLYYKIKLEAQVDPAVTPAVSEARAIYDGTAAPPLPAADYYRTGSFVSTNLMDVSSTTMTGFERFGYSISYLPFGATVQAQFSQDTVNWFSSNGTAWAYDTLSFGDHYAPGTALNLSALGWKGSANFYYKIKYTLGADNNFSPIVDLAGLIYASAQTASGTPLALPIAEYDFDEGYGAAAHNSGLNCTDALQCVSTQGTLTPGGGGTNDTAAKMWDNGGIYGRAIELDGTDDYVSVPDFGY
jgi:hypothetical protein